MESAVRKHKYSNWAGIYSSFPELFYQPRSVVELREIVTQASKRRRRVCLYGCGHSPSDLTCTSSWLVNLDYLDRILDVEESSGIVTMEAGIRLEDLRPKLKEHGLMLRNIGSIDHQSIAGAISTSTHGSSLQHGLLSTSVTALKIMLADGTIRRCSEDENLELFRAALVSLGALGIIIEVSFKTVPAFKIEWEQQLLPMDTILGDWDQGLWDTAEFTRVWWMPYMKKAIRWRASKTSKAISVQRKSRAGAFKGVIGFHLYQCTLYISTFFPSLLPLVEKVFFSDEKVHSGVEEGHKGLLMDCLYSQFVNEWGIPLHKGPEAITRLSKWLNHEDGSDVPFDSKGVYIHAPIEVRISDTSKREPRPFLDFTNPAGPTLFFNATLYRPYHRDPYAWKRYYEAFEWLMKELGGRPHWAKNFITVKKDEIHAMYENMGRWLAVRRTVDPEGMFVGDWHRRLILDEGLLPLEEKVSDVQGRNGDLKWFGEMRSTQDKHKVSGHDSDESFEVLDEGEPGKIKLIDHD